MVARDNWPAIGPNWISCRGPARLPPAALQTKFWIEPWADALPRRSAEQICGRDRSGRPFPTRFGKHDLVILPAGGGRAERLPHRDQREWTRTFPDFDLLRPARAVPRRTRVRGRGASRRRHGQQVDRRAPSLGNHLETSDRRMLRPCWIRTNGFSQGSARQPIQHFFGQPLC